MAKTCRGETTIDFAGGGFKCGYVFGAATRGRGVNQLDHWTTNSECVRFLFALHRQNVLAGEVVDSLSTSRRLASVVGGGRGGLCAGSDCGRNFFDSSQAVSRSGMVLVSWDGGAGNWLGASGSAGD